MSEPTEEPSPRRLARARREGDSGASPFASKAVALLATLAVLPAAVRATASWWTAAMTSAIAHVPEASTAAFDVLPTARAVVTLGAPVLLVAAAASAATTLAQTGGVVAFGRLAPDLGRANPLAGFGRIFSWSTAAVLARAAGYAAVATLLAFAFARAHAREVAHLAGRDAAAAAPFALAAVQSLWRRIALAGIAAAIADMTVTRVLWRRRLRMTKAELDRERRESDGDPHLKEARRHAFHELLASATRIEDASLVVATENDAGVALRWVRGEDVAPVVVAAGAGVARAGRVAGLTVVDDADLAARLANAPLGSAISPSLYDAVADHLVAAGSASR